MTGSHATEAVELLKTTGAALFGSRWKAPLAAHIGVTRETVSRWCNGAAALPEWALLFLREVVKARGAVLSLCDRTGIMLTVGKGRFRLHSRGKMIEFINAGKDDTSDSRLRLRDLRPRGQAGIYHSG